MIIIQRKSGHFGDYELGSINVVGKGLIGVLILRKAPLKYYDTDLPDTNKDKADVIYTCEDGVWTFGAFDHNPEGPDYTRIAEVIRDKNGWPDA